MNKLLKTTYVVLGACFVAGLVAYGALTFLVERQRAEVARAAVPRTPTRSEPVEVEELIGQPVGWVFRLSGAAKDDPESGRAYRTDVEFLGVVDHCEAASSRGGQALGLDLAGGPAAAAREARVCVPGCQGFIPPPARTVSLPRQLELSAFQEEFDRASADYAPQGSATLVDWQCDGHAGRVIVASVVVLACNVDECADEQLANASVFLGTESGRQLGAAKAFFSLMATSKAPVLGTSSIP